MPNTKKKRGNKKTCRVEKSTAHGPDIETELAASFWTLSEECAYYSNLGCHIANIARLSNTTQTKTNTITGKKGLTHASTLSCSQYSEMYQAAMQSYPWLLGIEQFDPSEYHPEDLERIPEIGLDDGLDDNEDEWEDADIFDEGNGGCPPSTIERHKFMTLTLTNIKDSTNVCFVTVWDVDLCGRDGRILTSGWNVTQQVAPMSTLNGCKDSEMVSTDENSIEARRKCTTFIVLCPPRTFVHLCHLAPNQSVSTTHKNGIEESGDSNRRVPITSWSQVEIENDIQPWSRHQNVNDEHSTLIHFPFCEVKDSIHDKNMTIDNTQMVLPTKQRASYQCIQSENGQLTHFFHGNYHAVDFACPIGTTLYSPVDGVVVNVNDKNGNNAANDNPIFEVSGIAATNLFHWNSIMIRADPTSNANDISSTDMNPLFVEYVHIQSKSCLVQIGDHVAKGQLICKSGSVGFSPTPHLHLSAYRNGDDGAESVRVRFECAGKENGRGRNADGKVYSFFPLAGGWYDEFGLVQTGKE
ncbi:hypothetical protein ACHAW6_002575 [Cyclotella cf. meneghiniana]